MSEGDGDRERERERERNQRGGPPHASHYHHLQDVIPTRQWSFKPLLVICHLLQDASSLALVSSCAGSPSGFIF